MSLSLYSNKAKFLLPIFLLLLCGCFETDFQFKTTINAKGYVEREMQADGRGAHLFLAPDGPGWASKSWQTDGEEALLPATYHHILARGSFSPGQEIAPDYQFNLNKLGENWQKRNKERMEKAGIKTPYADHLFTRNEVKIRQNRAWFGVTTVYEEVFRTEGVVPLLIVDLKEEIRRQSVARGENFSDEELEQLARLRLEDEILPEIRFKSEVVMPGKIQSTNGKSSGANSAVWIFTLKDFEKNYSVYTLKASSRSLTQPVMLVLAAGLGMFLVVIGILIIVLSRKKSAGNKKRKPKT